MQDPGRKPGVFVWPDGLEKLPAQVIAYVVAAFVAVFVLWVVDVNFNGGRYTDAAVRMIRPAAS